MTIEQELQQYSEPAVRTGEGAWEKLFQFPPCFTGFQGHFPGMPILPALIQLRMVRMLLFEAEGEAGVPETDYAKFMAPATPDMHLAVSLFRRGGGWTAGIFATGVESLTKISDFRLRVPSHEKA